MGVAVCAGVLIPNLGVYRFGNLRFSDVGG